MDNDTPSSSLEDRRLLLEERKLQSDLELLQLKAKEGGWFARFSPLTTTLIAGILTLGASAIGVAPIPPGSSAAQQID